MTSLDKKLVILGSKGMLGQMVKAYFTGKVAELICFDNRYTIGSRKEYVQYLSALRDVIIINCIGKIKQKTTDASELLFVNTILPADLRNVLHKDIILVHPGTDCVFNGNKGHPYSVSNVPDAEDEYGWSKRLGEVALEGRPNTLLPRVSIIGPDNNINGKGLMAWAFSQKGNPVKGFTNHFWNGITTLEWCRQIENFLINNVSFPFQLIQYGTEEFYSKYEMLQLFNELYELELNIEPFQAAAPIDRRLIPNVTGKPLREQLEELKALMSNG